jgi:hypothetical protein
MAHLITTLDVLGCDRRRNNQNRSKLDQVEKIYDFTEYVSLARGVMIEISVNFGPPPSLMLPVADDVVQHLASAQLIANGG